MKSFNLKTIKQKCNYNKKKAYAPVITFDPSIDVNMGIPQLIRGLVQQGWNTTDIESYIAQIESLQTNMPLVKDMGDSLNQAEQAKNEALQNAGFTEQQAKEIGMQPTAKTKIFNLKKAQVPFTPEQPPMDDMGLNDSPELMEPETIEEKPAPLATLKFESGIDLKKWLDNPNRSSTMARTELLSFIEDPEIEEVVARGIDTYFEAELKPNDQVLIAVNLFNLLPSVLKLEEADESEIPAHFTEGCIKDTNEIIKKMAKNKITKKIGKYNLQKIAQHKTMNNVIEYGPSNKPIIDPFYRMPVSDWHIVERNKGFGQDIGGIWNIDYETLWRTHIMDKYSRPYRDKEGNWVGGYIQKRFEVDKNIPEATNIQLKPGQRRKPRLPEYGLTESRLQDARAKGNIEGAIDTSKPFNWKEAQSKKKVSIAS